MNPPTPTDDRRARSEEREEILAEKYPTMFDGVHLNEAVPDKFSFPQKYWRWGPPVRQIHWLLDQNRLDDAIIYYIHELEPCQINEIKLISPFDPWEPCSIELTHNVFWRCGSPLAAEHVVRLAKQGRIEAASWGFVPVHPETLQGSGWRISGRIATDVRYARREPRTGYATPRQFFGRLRVGPNSGIDQILADVAFLSEPPNPAYAFPAEDPANAGRSDHTATKSVRPTT